jgi:hypothetical protein
MFGGRWYEGGHGKDEGEKAVKDGSTFRKLNHRKGSLVTGVIGGIKGPPDKVVEYRRAIDDVGLWN